MLIFLVLTKKKKIIIDRGYSTYDNCRKGNEPNFLQIAVREMVNYRLRTKRLKYERLFSNRLVTNKISSFL